MLGGNADQPDMIDVMWRNHPFEDDDEETGDDDGDDNGFVFALHHDYDDKDHRHSHLH